MDTSNCTVCQLQPISNLPWNPVFVLWQHTLKQATNIKEYQNFNKSLATGKLNYIPLYGTMLKIQLSDFVNETTLNKKIIHKSETGWWRSQSADFPLSSQPQCNWASTVSAKWWMANKSRTFEVTYVKQPCR